MQRDFKFRAWDTLFDQMYDWDFISHINLAMLLKGELPFIPMQYTGLKDKNGKEIYEGDIVKGFIPEIANEPERKGVVEFGNYGWIINFKTKEWECKISKVGFCSFRDYEVIGNIYDNPELS